MRKTLVWYSAALVGMLFMSAAARAQDPLDRDSWNVNEGDWGNDDNWVDDVGEPSGAPTTENDRWALVGSGKAIVNGDHTTSGLTIGNGTVEIAAGASLEVALQDGAFSVGQTEINRGGTLRILGDGSFKGLDGNILGTIEMGQTGSFELSGDANLQGTYNLGVTGAGSAVLKVGGEATVGGTVAPTFTDTSPGFGETITFVEANTVKLSRPSLELPAGVTLPRGLQARIVADGGKANITFGNLPILQVNRGTADAKIMNVVGGPVEITGYVIESELGTLDPNGFSGFGGTTWDRPNPLPTSVAEFNLTETKSIAVDESLDIGKLYNGGATHPRNEDVTFSFSTPGGEIIAGLVEYTGPANDLVLNINPETGEATIQNLSSFIDPIEVTGYSVVSASETLKVDEWKSLEKAGATGWLETTPRPGLISELNLSDSTIFSQGTVVSLGNIFDLENGERDLVLQYTTTTNLREATVEYQIPMPIDNNFLEADFNKDGIVNFTDFLVLSTQFNQTVDPPGTPPDINGNGIVDFPDFLVLSTQFNMTSGGAAAVPEPHSSSVLALGGLLMLAVRRRRQRATAIALGAIS